MATSTVDYLPKDIEDLAYFVGVVGAIITAVRALVLYERSKRQTTAKWLHELFRDFYLTDEFLRIREEIEYKCDQVLAPLVEKRITDRHVPLTEEEIDLLSSLDNLLNYLEFLLYLESKKQLPAQDRKALFSYWFSVLSASNNSSIRRYIQRFEFRRLADLLQANSAREPFPQNFIEYLALYGTLRLDSKSFKELELDKLLSYAGTCTIPGDLYDFDTFPGLVPGLGQANGDLFRFTDLSVLQTIDTYEEYDPQQSESSLFIRRCIRLASPPKDVWVYLYNGDLSPGKLISTGEWVEERWPENRT